MGSGKVRQCIVCIICSLSGFVASAAHGWFEPLTIRLADDPELDLTSEDVSWLMAVLMIGAGISPLVSGCLTNRIGRRLLVASIAPLCLVGWIIILYSKSMFALTTARVIHGLASGMVLTIPPIYTAEIAEPKLRGRLSGFFMVFCNLGIMYSFSLGPYLSYDMFAYACLPLPIIFTIIWVFMPETPYYLLMTNREEEAKKVLAYFRDGDVKDELEQMQAAVVEEMSVDGSWKTLFCDRVERKAFIIVQIVSAAKYLTGLAVFENYALDTFSRAESFLSPEGMTILLAGIFTSIGVVVAFLSDWAGRKPLLLLSCFGCFLANLLTGGYYYIHEKTTIDASGLTWALYVGLFMYCVFSDIGVGPILQTMQSEMFGASTRGIAGGLTEGISSFLALILIKLYIPVTEAYGVYLNFLSYSLIALVSGVFLLCFAYETKGRTIGQMGGKEKKSSIALSP